MYQNEGQGWQSTSIVIDAVRSSDQLISHAAIGEEGADLLVTTFDHSSRMRLYRVSIEWNATQHSRQAGMVFTLVAPTMEVHHLTASHHTRAQHAHSARLTHLEVIPAVPEAAQTTPTSTMILAIFAQTSVSSDANPSQNAYSVIARWRVESLLPTLHDSFRKLNHNRTDSTTVLNTITALRRQPDIITNKPILSFSTQMFDSILAFASSDGSIDTRDRVTMDQLGPFGEDPSTASSLPQAGFDHLPSSQSLHVAISADGSGIVSVPAHSASSTSSHISARPMTFTHGWEQATSTSLIDTTPYIECATACLARQYAFLCYNSMSNDEVLSLLPSPIPPTLRSTLIALIFKMVNRSPDISTHENTRQQMTVLKEPVVPRVLSAQLSLGTDPVTGRRDFSGQYAYIFLNLRHIGTALAHTISQKDLSRISPEAVHSLRPLVRWSIDLIISIVDTLVELKRNHPSTSSTTYTHSWTTHISRTSSPHLHLLLASFSRALLRFQVAWIGKYLQLINHILPRLSTLQQRTELSALQELGMKGLPFRLSLFEALLADVDVSVRGVYSGGTIDGERRGEIEVGLITGGGEVPVELESVVERIMRESLAKVTDAEGTDLVKLYFWETAWLGVEGGLNAGVSDGRAKKGQASERQVIGNKKRWDVIRKVEISPGAEVRNCRRCGSVMEDLTPEKVRSCPAWLGHAQKHCVCMNYWVCG
jgi:mediator of RNA polymerase II transcription subunit 16